MENKIYVIFNKRMKRYLTHNFKHDRWIEDINQAKIFTDGPSQYAKDELAAARFVAYYNDPDGSFEDQVLMPVTLTTETI